MFDNGNSIVSGVNSWCPCVYTCVYAYTRADFFLLFLIFSVEEGATRLTPKKFTVFTGKIKVGPKCPIFIRGDPYEPHKPPEKSLFKTISWGGSRYLKVINSFVWHQSW